MTTEESGRKITLEEWEQFPAKPPKAPDKYAALLDEVERGAVYVLPYADDKDLRGKRIGLGRRATQRGFKLEIRTRDHEMAIRRSDSPRTAPATGAEMKPRGRGRRGAAASE